MPILANDRAVTRDQSPLVPAILRHVTYSLGTSLENVSPREKFQAIAFAIRDRMIDSMLQTEQRYQQANAKRMYYLSMEFLIGRSLDNNLVNLKLRETCQDALRELGWSLEEIEQNEVDAALGNGGLGRLAACFLDSLATLGLPGFGYGINYEYGLFRQEIRQGEQVEKPDNWRTFATPWEIERPEETIVIPLYGRVEHAVDRQGRYNPMWLDWQVLVGVPNDIPIVGYGGETVNYLRLYSARASQEFDMNIFNEGDYVHAVHAKVRSETVSKVLYPKEAGPAGRELRLIQEYFLSACAVRDIIRRYRMKHSDFTSFPNKVAIQLNDTHPTLAIAELMRIFVDESEMPWEQAWELTQATFAYTNHTLLPEALERWPISLLEYVLPRHTQIMYEINRRFLEQVRRDHPDNPDLIRSVSLIEEGGEKQARMANMAIVGSHSVNGVAAVHSKLVQTDLVPDFAKLMPEKFNNKTNGVTPRRWLLSSNPSLSRLISDAIGTDWITDLMQLRELERFLDDASFIEQLIGVKQQNKRRFVEKMEDLHGVSLDGESIFDVQVKRIHEYKRQLLNILHVVHEYLCLVEDGRPPIYPKTYLYGGKAAPGYYAAKLIIRLINDVAKVINSDPRAKGHIQVFFVPDYRVSMAEIMIPAANISEQISTAGTEASGTGNMKFALNGALTVGTMDGANIEIFEEVGADNIFIFGLSVAEVKQWRERGYEPWSIYHEQPAVRRVIDAFTGNRFCQGTPGRHQWVADRLLESGERYFHLADLASYIETQEEAARQYQDRSKWGRMAMLNIARAGKFSSDRTISEYASEIWNIKPVL